MITWMQRHKKWLVITIWISTIAFVGAGFVGWGSYEYGKEGGVVAVVGDREVSVEEYQEEYSNLYEQYSNLFGTMFNKEMADKLNLKDIAYNQVIQKNLILSYGDKLGLDVTNEDIAKQLLKYDAFLKDGKFDKETYVRVLNQNRMTPVKFEESLKRNILLQKIQGLFVLEPSKIEVENLSKVLFIEDDISIKIIDSKDVSVEIKEDELKKYWEENKNSYMSKVVYNLQTSEMPLQSSNSSDEDIQANYDKFKTDYKKEDGKIKSLEEAKADIIKSLDEKYTKTEALKTYLKIKKGEESLSNDVSYTEDKLPFLAEDNTKILEARNGDLIKPFYENGKYITVKLVEKIQAKPLSFEDALAQVKVDFEQIARSKKLDELANAQLKDFEGLEIKGISRESIDKITGLDAQNAAKFLNQLFSSTTKEGIVKLDTKVVLYKILDSKFGKYDESKDEIVKSTLKQLQDQELMANLIKRLENTYDIQSSIQTKDQ